MNNKPRCGIVNIFFKNKKWVLRSKSSKWFILTVFLVRRRSRVRWKKKLLGRIGICLDELVIRSDNTVIFWISYNLLWTCKFFFFSGIKIGQIFYLFEQIRYFFRRISFFFGQIGYSLGRITICADK